MATVEYGTVANELCEKLVKPPVKMTQCFHTTIE